MLAGQKVVFHVGAKAAQVQRGGDVQRHKADPAQEHDQADEQGVPQNVRLAWGQRGRLNRAGKRDGDQGQPPGPLRAQHQRAPETVVILEKPADDDNPDRVNAEGHGKRQGHEQQTLPPGRQPTDPCNEVRDTDGGIVHGDLVQDRAPPVRNRQRVGGSNARSIRTLASRPRNARLRHPRWRSVCVASWPVRPA